MKTLITVHALVRHNSKFLVLQRSIHRSDPGTWNCVTGYIKDRESAEKAALRELYEETNLKGKIVKAAEPYWVDLSNVRWVVILFLVDVKNIDKLMLDKNESQNHKWIDPNDEIVHNSSVILDNFERLGIKTNG